MGRQLVFRRELREAFAPPESVSFELFDSYFDDFACFDSLALYELLG